MKKYPLPPFLYEITTQKAYEKWLKAKTAAHIRRDRKRVNVEAIPENYRIGIHEAVFSSGGKDAYTGEDLDWTLIGTWDNDDSKAGGAEYKALYARLPTVDHAEGRIFFPPLSRQRFGER